MDIHNERRKHLCLVCCSRATRVLTQALIVAVQLFLIEDYSKENMCLPSGICDNCRIGLQSFQRGDFSRHLPEWFDYTEMRGFRPQRGATDCNCKLCTMSQMRGKFGTSSSKSKRKRKLSSDSKSEQPFKKMCGTCFTVSEQGRHHICTREQRVKNINNMVSPKTLSMLAYASVKRDIDENKVAKVQPKSHGRPLELCKSNESTDNNSNHLTLEAMQKIKVEENLSTNQTIAVAKHIRKNLGRNSVEPHLKPYLHEQSVKFAEFFSAGLSINKLPLIFCNNVTAFKDKIVELRNTTPSIIKVGFDTGRSQLKATLSIVDEETANSSSKFLSSGVKKLFIICTTIDSKESYEAAKHIWQACNLNSIEHFWLTVDLKMVNIVIGICSHSASFPCPFCHWPKANRLDGPWEQRSFENIRENNRKWLENGGKVTNLKKFYNCAHQPLFDGDGSVISRVSFPSLHVQSGLVNTLYEKLVAVYPAADEWSQKLHIVKEAMHSGKFNGNDTRKLLRKVQILRDVCKENTPVPPIVFQYCDTFDALNEVVEACFGPTLASDFEEKIHNFRQLYLSLDISVTSKAHLLFTHAAEFIHSTGKSFSIYAEQSAESSHADFDVFWDRYKVRDNNHPNLSDQLLHCVNDYNGNHC